MSDVVLKFHGEAKDDYPTLAVRLLDDDIKVKYRALRAAKVQIAETFRPLAYELIDAAFEKLQQT